MLAPPEADALRSALSKPIGAIRGRQFFVGLGGAISAGPLCILPMDAQHALAAARYIELTQCARGWSSGPPTGSGERSRASDGTAGRVRSLARSASPLGLGCFPGKRSRRRVSGTIRRPNARAVRWAAKIFVGARSTHRRALARRKPGRNRGKTRHAGHGSSV